MTYSKVFITYSILSCTSSRVPNMVISEPTPFVAGRFEKPLRFASNQQMQINIFSFFQTYPV